MYVLESAYKSSTHLDTTLQFSRNPEIGYFYLSDRIYKQVGWLLRTNEMIVDIFIKRYIILIIKRVPLRPCALVYHVSYTPIPTEFDRRYSLRQTLVSAQPREEVGKRKVHNVRGSI